MLLQNFKSLFQHTGFQNRIRTASFYSIANKIFDLAPPIVTGTAVDILIQKENSWLGKLGFIPLWQQIFILGGITALVTILESITEYLATVKWRKLAQDVEHRLRLDCYAHVQNLDLHFFEEKSSAQLMSVLNDDVNQLERFLDVGANEVLQISTNAIVVGGIFFYLIPQTALYSMLPMPFIIWGSFYFQRRIAPYYHTVRELVGGLNQKLMNNLSGIVTIKSYTTEPAEVQNIETLSDEYRVANHKVISVSSTFTPLLRMLVEGSFIFTLIRGAFLVESGVLSVASFSVMIFLIQRFLWPFTRLAQTVDLYQRAQASVKRIQKLLQTPIAVKNGTDSLTLKVGEGHIHLQNVNFEYLAGHPVLKNLSLECAAGQTVGIVGTTGSGKSTLIKLILRLYDVTSGQITLNGIPLSRLSFADLRKNIALVTQDVFLFHGTARANILYGNPNATEAQMLAAAKTAMAHDFITKLPQGYDTIVGERGIKLSGGQRQRVSIARAILKNAPILILDEATSSIDNETEAAIQKSLALVSKNRTTLVLAHRLSTIRHAHKIVVIEEGQVSQTGTHNELLQQGGLYKNLWDVQTGEVGFG